jgi:hypothetical protein
LTSVNDPSERFPHWVCVGSCDSQAINLPALNSREVEKHPQSWTGKLIIRVIT